MKRISLVILISVLVTVLSASRLFLRASDDFSKIEIRILPEAVVYEDRFLLGDIAELNGLDVEAIRTMSELPMGQAPLPGRSFVLSEGRIKNRLGKRFANKILEWHFPEQMIVSRASIAIHSSELKNIILQEVRKEYANHDHIKVKVKNKLQDFYVPKGELSFQLKRMGGKTRLGGTSSWSLDVLIDEKEVKKVWVMVKVSVYQEILVAKEEIWKGTIISLADLKRIQKDVSREKTDFQTEEALFLGKSARRDIRKNEMLRPSLVENPLVVKEGKYVRLMYQKAGVRLSTVAVAITPGRVGEMIPVKNIRSNKIVRAIVIDATNVRVVL